MRRNQFIAACKNVGVNIKSLSCEETGIKISYNYDLPGNAVSSIQRVTYTYVSNDLQLIYNNHFLKAGEYARF